VGLEEEEEEGEEEEEVACFALYVVVSRKGAKLSKCQIEIIDISITLLPPSLPPSLHT